MHLISERTRMVGTPEQIADRLEDYRAAGVDGVNVVNATIPGSYQEFIDQVMPVLRERGLANDGYREGTLRRKLSAATACPSAIPPPSTAAPSRPRAGGRSRLTAGSAFALVGPDSGQNCERAREGGPLTPRFPIRVHPAPF